MCLAEFQHAGRGRRGRRWIAPLGGGLCLSVGWQFADTPPELSALTLAVGVVARRALAAVAGVDVGLKWPNDLVLDARKLGGILLELTAEAQGGCYVVAGIGINVSLPPESLRTLSDWPRGAIDLATATSGAPPRARRARGELDRRPRGAVRRVRRGGVRAVLRGLARSRLPERPQRHARGCDGHGERHCARHRGRRRAADRDRDRGAPARGLRRRERAERRDAGRDRHRQHADQVGAGRRRPSLEARERRASRLRRTARLRRWPPRFRRTCRVRSSRTSRATPSRASSRSCCASGRASFRSSSPCGRSNSACAARTTIRRGSASIVGSPCSRRITWLPERHA